MERLSCRWGPVAALPALSAEPAKGRPQTETGLGCSSLQGLQWQLQSCAGTGGFRGEGAWFMYVLVLWAAGVSGHRGPNKC